MKKFVLSSFALALGLSAFAADATGKWNGKIIMDLSAVKKMIKQKAASVPADKKSTVEQQLKALDMTEKTMSKATLAMDLKKDHTVTVTQTSNGKPDTDTGQWSQVGNKIRVFGFKKKTQGPKELNGILGANGKTLIFDLSAEMKKQAVAGGAPAGFTGKMVLSFNKA